MQGTQETQKDMGGYRSLDGHAESIARENTGIGRTRDVRQTQAWGGHDTGKDTGYQEDMGLGGTTGCGGTWGGPMTLGGSGPPGRECM